MTPPPVPDRMTSLPHHVLGASASQTGPSQVEPVPVSPLRASVPSAENLGIAQMVVAELSARKDCYPSWTVVALSAIEAAREHDAKICDRIANARCDFCSRKQTDVYRMIANGLQHPSHICDVCVGIAADVIANERRLSTPRAVRWHVVIGGEE